MDVKRLGVGSEGEKGVDIVGVVCWFDIVVDSMY